MPSKKMPRGERLPVAYPLTGEMKNTIKAAVVAEYERVTGGHVSTQADVVEVHGETRHEIQQRMDALARQR